MIKRIIATTQSELDAIKIDEPVFIYIKSKDTICVSTKYYYSVEACGNSSVKAYGNSSVSAYGNSSVTAYDNSSILAYEHSSVAAYDNSFVEAREHSSVAAWDNSSVKAYGNSSVTAYDNSFVEAYENSGVYNNSEKTKIELYSYSVCWELKKSNIVKKSKTATIIKPNKNITLKNKVENLFPYGEVLIPIVSNEENPVIPEDENDSHGSRRVDEFIEQRINKPTKDKTTLALEKEIKIARKENEILSTGEEIDNTKTRIIKAKLSQHLATKKECLKEKIEFLKIIESRIARKDYAFAGNLCLIELSKLKSELQELNK